MAVSVNTDDCIGCGVCADACPQSVLVVDDVCKVESPDDCIECGICVSECPVEALTL